MTIRLSVTQVNATAGHCFEELTEEAVPFAILRREFGGRVSRVFVDHADGPVHVGWMFTRRVEYDDAHRIRDPRRRTFKRVTWATYFRDVCCTCCGTVRGREHVPVEEARSAS